VVFARSEHDGSSDDLLSYLDPSTWLQDVPHVGNRVGQRREELDDRIDRVETEIDRGRQRAREELCCYSSASPS
jgi:hypothetical protein